VLRVRPDTDGPDTQAFAPSLGAFPTSTDATFDAFQGNEPEGYLGPAPSVFECSLDGTPFTRCTAPVQLHGLSVGTHEFRVRAYDAAGNPDPSPLRFAWEIRPQMTTTPVLPPTFVPIVSPPPSSPGGKLLPAGLTVHVHPARDRRAPYVFSVSGTLRLRSASTAADCGGTVTTTLAAGHRQHARRTVPVSSKCAWTARLTTGRRGRLVVSAAYNGSSRLGTWNARPVKVRAG
jgi:hypothetical protein